MKFLKPNKFLNYHRLVYINLSLKNRLWLFQIVVVLIILACIFTIAGSSGIIADLSENPYHSVKNDLKDSETELSKKCLAISNNTIELSKKIDKSIKKQLTNKGLDPSQLNNHPELLEEILSSEVEKSCFAMEKAGVSGVFVFLNATVNPALERAKDSKAGFFIVNMNQNPLPYESQQLFLLYGPVQLARENNMHLHTQWELELNVAPNTFKRRTDLFKKPFEAAISNKGEDIYNLGYWNPLCLPADNTDKVITFSVPLIDKSGNPYGVCGLEMSRTSLENILWQKSSPEFEREVLLLSTQAGAGINMDNALICGLNSSWLRNDNSKYLYVSPISNKSEKLTDFYFTASSKDRVLGCDVNARLYPMKSVFKEELWTLALLLPKDDVTAKTARLYYALAQLLLLFIASIFITLFTSRYCINPVLDAIKKLKDNELEVKTNITEIDDLIQFLRERSETSSNGELSPHQSPQQQQRKTQTSEELSPHFSSHLREPSLQYFEQSSQQYPNYTHYPHNQKKPIASNNEEASPHLHHYDDNGEASPLDTLDPHDLLEFPGEAVYGAAFGQSGSIFKTAVQGKNEAAFKNSRQEASPLSPEQYTQFENRLMTLSNAERKIFDLYIEGHDAKDICKILYISINTLKTHNRRIYTKMNVCSRVELLKYCNELMGKL